MKTNNVYLPHEAIIVDKIEDSPSIFTLRLRFADASIHKHYRFLPGQFNMLYLYGVGEVAISIVSDPKDEHLYDHTIRIVGRVTRGLARLKIGDSLGIRGPYGRGWPIQAAMGRDIIVLTGGLGCAPVIAGINYFFNRRSLYKKIYILQGVKHHEDLIYRDRYQQWSKMSNTQVLLSADISGPQWPFLVGNAVQLLEKIDVDVSNVLVLMCGPEIMMKYAIKTLQAKGVLENDIYLSMERNMQCAVGHCGHCQYGNEFICKNGPVFSFSEIKHLFDQAGF